VYYCLSSIKVLHLLSFHVNISSALDTTWISMCCVHSQLDSHALISSCDLVRVSIVPLSCVESGWRMEKMQHRGVLPWRLWKSVRWSWGHKHWPHWFAASPVQQSAWTNGPALDTGRVPGINILPPVASSAWITPEINMRVKHLIGMMIALCQPHHRHRFIPYPNLFI